jgi:hypothetical protein
MCGTTFAVKDREKPARRISPVFQQVSQAAWGQLETAWTPPLTSPRGAGFLIGSREQGSGDEKFSRRRNPALTCRLLPAISDFMIRTGTLPSRD